MTCANENCECHGEQITARNREEDGTLSPRKTCPVCGSPLVFSTDIPMNRRDAMRAVAILPFTNTSEVAPGRAATSHATAIPLVDIGRFFANNDSKARHPSDGIQVTVAPWKAGVTAAVICGPRGILPSIERTIRRNLAAIVCVAWSDDRRAFTIFAECETEVVDWTMDAALNAPGRRGLVSLDRQSLDRQHPAPADGPLTCQSD